MRVWCSESTDKRAFMDYLSDVYSKKPVLVCDVRNVYNACVRNFTVANDPHSSKFESTSNFIRAAVRELERALPSEIVVFHDWLAESVFTEVDYFLIHSPEDSDAIFRVKGGEFDIVKEQARALDQWKKIRLKALDKMLVLSYDERVRDAFTVDEEAPQGVTLRLSPDFVASHKPKVDKPDSMIMERLFNPRGEKKEISNERGNSAGYPQ